MKLKQLLSDALYASWLALLTLIDTSVAAWLIITVIMFVNSIPGIVLGIFFILMTWWFVVKQHALKLYWWVRDV